MLKESVPLISSRPSDTPQNFYQKVPRKILISWKDLSLQVASTLDPNYTLTKPVSGYANPGEILAVLGQSGCGKSSFLSCLSQRLSNFPKSRSSGQIFLNHKECDKYELKKHVGFLSQDSVLFDTLTPFEILNFVSLLTSNKPETARREKLGNLISSLKLEKVMNTKIGNTLNRGISDGEKKRVSIAVLLLMNQDVFVIDELTSGLDSELCKIVIDLLVTCKLKGKTIILSIHQPSNYIYQNFDRAIFMCEGRFVYQGPAKEVKKYFEGIGINFTKKNGDLETIIRRLNIIDRNNLSEPEKKLLSQLDDSYSSLDIFKNISRDIEQELPIIKKKTTSWTVLKTLIYRSRINIIRSPYLLLIKLVHTTTFLLIVLPLFYNLGYTQKDIEYRKNMIALFCQATISYTYLALSLTIPSERPVVKKEYDERLYSLTSYFISKIVMELPLQLAYITIVVFIVYFQVNLNHDTFDKFFIFLGLCYLGVTVSIILAYSLGMVFPNFKMARSIRSVFNLVFLVYSGMAVNDSSRVKAFKWMNYISPYYYLFRALMINEFSGLEIDHDALFKPDERYDLDGEIWIICIQFAGYGIGLFLVLLIMIKIRIIE